MWLVFLRSPEGPEVLFVYAPIQTEVKVGFSLSFGLG